MVRDAVKVIIDLHVIIDVHPRGAPVGELVRPLGQRLERRPIELLEEFAPLAVHLLKPTIVQLFQQPGDGLVQFPEAEKLLIPEPGQDPAFGEKY